MALFKRFPGTCCIPSLRTELSAPHWQATYPLPTPKRHTFGKGCESAPTIGCRVRGKATTRASTLQLISGIRLCLVPVRVIGTSGADANYALTVVDNRGRGTVYKRVSMVLYDYNRSINDSLAIPLPKFKPIHRILPNQLVKLKHSTSPAGIAHAQVWGTGMGHIVGIQARSYWGRRSFDVFFYQARLDRDVAVSLRFWSFNLCRAFPLAFR